jgi:hypothetical protein
MRQFLLWAFLFLMVIAGAVWFLGYYIGNAIGGVFAGLVGR